MGILLFLAAVVALIFAFKYNIILGLVLLAALIGILIYRLLPSYYIMNGNKAFSAGDEDGALAWYKKAYDTGRTKVEMKTSYAYMLLRTGHADEAEKVLDPIIRVASLAPEKKNLAKQQRCMVYYKQGRLDEAMEDAEALMESGFRNTNLYGMLGYFKLVHGDDMKDTLSLCEEAYEYNSDNKDINDNLALCYYNLGRYNEAAKHAEKVIELAPDFLEGYYHGAQIAVKMGDYKKAAEYLEKTAQCRRSNLTTVTEKEVEELIQEVKNH